MLLPLRLNLETTQSAEIQFALHAVVAVLAAGAGASVAASVLDGALAQAPSVYGTGTPRDQAYMYLLSWQGNLGSGRTQGLVDKARSGLRQAGASNTTAGDEMEIS